MIIASGPESGNVLIFYWCMLSVLSTLLEQSFDAPLKYFVKSRISSILEADNFAEVLCSCYRLVLCLIFQFTTFMGRECVTSF